MAFPLYLSYLTSEQKPAAACFVPQSGHPAARPTAWSRPGPKAGWGDRSGVGGASMNWLDCNGLGTGRFGTGRRGIEGVSSQDLVSNWWAPIWLASI